MKDMDRRDFLKLTGISVLALALAACDGTGTGTPPVAADSTKTKEEQAFELVNAWRYQHGLSDLVYDKDIQTLLETDTKLLAKYGKLDSDGSLYVCLPEVSGEVWDEWNAAWNVLRGKGYYEESSNLNGPFYYGRTYEADYLHIAPCPASQSAFDDAMQDLQQKLRKEGRQPKYIGISVITKDGKDYYGLLLFGKRNNE